MHTKTIPSRFIKLFTQYKYTHIALALNKSCDVVYSFGRKKYNSVIDAGFVEEHKTGKFFGKFKDTNVRIYELEITNHQYHKLKRKINYMKKHEELFKYDFLGIILRFFRLPVAFKNKYVCSYFVAKLLEDTGIWTFDKKPYFIEPKDFEKIDYIKEVYHGKYLLYK